MRDFKEIITEINDCKTTFEIGLIEESFRSIKKKYSLVACREIYAHLVAKMIELDPALISNQL